MKRSLNIWLLLVVVVAAFSFLYGRDLMPAGSSPPPAQPLPATPPERETAPPAEPIHLVVLNGTPEAGLAREFGLLLGRAGCVAEQVGNAPHDRYRASFLVNRRLDAESAQRLARRLGGLPVLQEFDGRTSADAVLVLGADVEAVRRTLSGTGKR